MDGPTLPPDEEQRRRSLVEEHGLLDDTGEWGEVITAKFSDDDFDHIELGNHEHSEIEVRNPIETASLSVKEKKLAAIKMKSAGASYRAIGEYFNCHATTAKRLVQDTLEEELHEDTSELRMIHYNRLEQMLGVYWDRALTGDPVAFDRVGNTMDRIERLYGLSAPNRTEHTHTNREAIVIAEGDTETYLKALQQAAEQRDSSIIDAEIVDDDS